jgi:hypothetical protein
MSGRVRWFRDGELVVGHRKTDRRNKARRPIAERLREINLRSIDKAAAPDAPAVRMAFLLPASLQGFVASGQHGIGVTVMARGFVQVRGHSAEQCFGLARDFLGGVARDRPAFTAYASLMSCRDPDRSFGRHLTVVSGALVVSAGYAQPKVFEARTT